MAGKYFLASGGIKDIKFCIKCLRSYKTDTDMVGFTGRISNIKEDFEGMIHRRHSDTNSYSKCGLPVWDVRDLRHYIQGDAIHANKDKLIDCPLCSEKKITTFEE